MKAMKPAGLSSRAGVAAGLAALLVSLLSFAFVVGLFASASGELDAVVAQARGAPAASASLAAGARRAGSG